MNKLDLDMAESDREQIQWGKVEKNFEDKVQPACFQTTGWLIHFQSAYRTDRLIETTLLLFWLDMLVMAGERKVTLLSLLDISATFNCINYLFMLQRLQVAVGIRDSALNWIWSFVGGRVSPYIICWSALSAFSW